MPRFYFNILRSDRIVADLDGEMLPDADAARLEAVAIARETLSIAIKSGDDPPDSIQAIDSEGGIVATITIDNALPGSMKK